MTKDQIYKLAFYINGLVQPPLVVTSEREPKRRALLLRIHRQSVGNITSADVAEVRRSTGLSAPTIRAIIEGGHLPKIPNVTSVKYVRQKRTASDQRYYGPRLGVGAISTPASIDVYVSWGD